MTTSFRFADWPLRAKMAALLVATALLPPVNWAYIDLRQDQARLLERQEPPRGPCDRIANELDSFHLGYQRSVDRMV